MSVYTCVSDEEMRALLVQYDLGEFVALQGIAQGITNSNFFLDTTTGRFVLTIFETLRLEELPFFLSLTRHLSINGVACPSPIIRKDGEMVSSLANKPACIVSSLKGSDTSWPTPKQCFNTGAMLAKMHSAGQSFTKKMTNPRFSNWWTEASTQLLLLLDDADATLLKSQIEFLTLHPDSNLPNGIIHADLFKDNVLLDGEEVAGFIDFYYACNGSFVYDLAIAINDWARTADNIIDKRLAEAFSAGYNSIRPLLPEESAYFHIAQRAGAVRFWISRLLDYHFPNEGEMTFIKDPNAFRDLLLSLVK